MFKIEREIKIATGGYQSWVVTSGGPSRDAVEYDGSVYHLHPTIPAGFSVAGDLGVPEGTPVAGVRWKDKIPTAI